jgi:hypothetical protein
MSLVVRWLQDQDGDNAPYYFSKAQFLDLYKIRCKGQQIDPDKSIESQCRKHRVDENDCLAGRELYCTFDQDKNQCNARPHSICPFITKPTAKWTAEAIANLDEFYQHASILEFSKQLWPHSAKRDIDAVVTSNTFIRLFELLRNDALSNKNKVFLRHCLSLVSK